MNRVTSKFVPALIALVGMLAAGSAWAATITPSLVLGQISNTSTFTTTTSVTISGATPSVTLLPGQFFRFGVAIVVTNNPNPEAGSIWDQANADHGSGAALPQNLGMAVVNGQVDSSDATGALLAAQALASGLSKATVGAGQTWASKSAGGVTGNGTGAGGKVGTSGTFTIFEGNGAYDPEDNTSPAKLAYFSSSANFFTGVAYVANAAGVVTLSPSLIPGLLNIWTNTGAGATSDGTTSGDPTANGGGTPPTYAGRVFGTGTPQFPDALGALPQIQVTITPEPASVGLIGLSLVGLLARRRKA